MKQIKQNKNKLFLNFILLTLGIFSVFIFGAKPVLAATYESTFTSQVFDNYHSSVDYGTMSWTVDIPANTSLVFSVRAGNVVAPDGSWTGWSVIANSGDSLNAYDGKRYIQYKVVLGTNDQSVTPTVYDVSMTANTSSLDSSVFDSEDAQNIIYAISWSETKPGASDVAFQIRTSPDNSTWTSWCGPDNSGTGCETESWFSDPNGGETIDAIFSDRSGDRYFQYRVILMSDGSNFPTVDDVNISYGSIDTYTVTFQDYDSTELKVETVDSGNSATAPTDPTRIGHTFIGWDTDFSNVTSDLTVIAQYEINSFTVTFQDYDTTELFVDYIDYGNSATAPTDPERDGYTFTGWDIDFSNVTTDLTVTAQYEINSYTVTFQDYDATELKIETVEHGSFATAPTDPIRTGYTFTGWDIDFSNVTTDLTVTAEYNINTFTVTFQDYDTTVLKIETVDYGSSATAPADPTRTGHTFTGWDTDFSNVTTDLTVTAEYDNNTYAVTFKDYDNTVLKTETVDYGNDATAPADPTRTGYTFTGWDNDFTNITQNLTVTAEYSINSYTITFDKNGGDTEANPITKIANYNASIDSLPTPPERENYNFSSWNTQLDGNGTAFTGATLVTESITVYAIWTINDYTLIYTAGTGGTISGTSPQTINYGEDGEEVEAIPNAGYHFVDWSDNSTENPRTDENITEDISVTANFAEDDSGDDDDDAGDQILNIPGKPEKEDTKEDEIEISWDENSNPEGTQYYAKNVTTGEDSGWKTKNSWTSKDLKCGQEYTFKVKAKNDTEETNYSKEIEIETDICEKDKIEIKAIQNACNSLGVTVSLGDEYEEEKIDFEIKIKNTKNDNNDTIEFKNQKTNKDGKVTMTISPLKKDSNYEVKVRFKSGDEYSDWSSKKEGKTTGCVVIAETKEKSTSQKEETNLATTAEEEKTKQQDETKKQKEINNKKQSENSKQSKEKDNLWNSMILGTSNFGKLLLENKCRSFWWLLLLLLVIIIIWWWRKRKREMEMQKRKKNQ